VRGVERFVNSMTWAPSGSKRKVKRKEKKQGVTTATMVQTLLVSIVACTAKTRVPTVTKTDTFQSIMHRLMTQYSYSILEVPPEELCARVSVYVCRITPRLAPTPSCGTLVAVVFAFLATGYTVNGVVIFPVHPWCAKRAPRLTAYTLVPGLQCRSMSTTTRALKRAMGVGGTISAGFVFG
jgi:hypothetical protein